MAIAASGIKTVETSVNGYIELYQRTRVMTKEGRIVFKHVPVKVRIKK